MGLVEAEELARLPGTVAIAVPDLALEVLVAAEEDGTRLGSQHHHQDRLGLAESGEVVEAAVPAVVVVRIGIARALGRGGQDHHAIAQRFREPRAARLEGLNLQGIFESHVVILLFGAGACSRIIAASSRSPEASRRAATRAISAGRFWDS